MRITAARSVALIAAALICLAGSLAGGTWSGVATSAGSWLTVAAIAVAHRRLSHRGRPGLAAGALCLLGVAAATGTIATTLPMAYPGSDLGLLRAIATLSSGLGLALLAGALLRAGMAPGLLAVAVAATAPLSSIWADPALPYVVGAGPLGVALLTAAIRACIYRARAATPAKSFRRHDIDRADRTLAVAFGGTR
jgi:hypothetical protein